jgi:hypothetical protein
MTREGTQGKGAKDDPEDRVRAVLDMTDDEPMPLVRLEPLRKFHDHLAANLSFPFEGRLSSPIGPHRDTETPLSVIRLLDVDTYGPEEMYGLICKAIQNEDRIELPLDRIDVDEDGPNRQMLEDYRWWMRTFR